MSSSGPSSGFTTSSFSGSFNGSFNGSFEAELSPEDLFNMFFGGGGPASSTGSGDLFCRVIG
jgi:hypothetical protein